jgi:hypothetical protein
VFDHYLFFAMRDSVGHDLYKDSSPVHITLKRALLDPIVKAVNTWGWVKHTLNRLTFWTGDR